MSVSRDKSLEEEKHTAFPQDKSNQINEWVLSLGGRKVVNSTSWTSGTAIRVGGATWKAHLDTLEPGQLVVMYFMAWEFASARAKVAKYEREL